MTASIDFFIQSILDLETDLGYEVALMDVHGAFPHALHVALIEAELHSHQRHNHCRLHFNWKACVDHCRYAMSERALKEPGGFTHHCWSKRREMVFPMMVSGKLEALLFVHHPTLTKAQQPWLRLFTQGLFQQLQALNEGHQDPLLKKIHDWIHRHSNDGSTLSDLAQALHLSNSRCSHLVKDHLGVSFQELMTNKRFEKARHLLTSTDLRVHQIADLLGYGSSSAFSLFFAKVSGKTPSQWRKEQKASNTPPARATVKGP